MRTIRTTGQFEVAAAVSGRVFTVIERTEFVWAERFNGPATIPWRASFETAEGYALTPLGEDRFEIAALGVCVQRVASQKLN
ncbi:MAG TPA: hypothetical protein VLV15_14490 [Dongiaceae bacterium]|nr:hypothetical protein [Dongiaceae bacterium]